MIKTSGFPWEVENVLIDAKIAIENEHTSLLTLCVGEITKLGEKNPALAKQLAEPLSEIADCFQAIGYSERAISTARIAATYASLGDDDQLKFKTELQWEIFFDLLPRNTASEQPRIYEARVAAAAAPSDSHFAKLAARKYSESVRAHPNIANRIAIAQCDANELQPPNLKRAAKELLKELTTAPGREGSPSAGAPSSSAKTCHL